MAIVYPKQIIKGCLMLYYLLSSITIANDQCRSFMISADLNQDQSSSIIISRS